MLLIFGVFVIGSLIAFYFGGRGLSYIIGNSHKVDVINFRADKDKQAAIFYHSVHGDAIGIMLDPASHKMNGTLFSTPVVDGKLNCNPISIRSVKYGDIR